ncbi:MAG: L,D-transpeptidase family protein [Reyranella sp.]|nr:L,D-transpeptidase family protein [Reyranella sp.]
MKTVMIVVAVAALGLAAWLFWRWPGRPVEVPAMAPADRQADTVEVYKAQRRLELKRDGQLLQSYRVALGFAPAEHKEREGDGRTPEGTYLIDARNPRSAFHLSLRVSYPDERDKARAAALGVPPGGDIYIHGQPNGPRKWFAGHPEKDWTTGCVAVTDAEMREIWSLVPTGARIVIHP